MIPDFIVTEAAMRPATMRAAAAAIGTSKEDSNPKGPGVAAQGDVVELRPEDCKTLPDKLTYCANCMDEESDTWQKYAASLMRQAAATLSGVASPAEKRYEMSFDEAVDCAWRVAGTTLHSREDVKAAIKAIWPLHVRYRYIGTIVSAAARGLVVVPREPTQSQKDAAGRYKAECAAHGRQCTVGGYYRAMVEDYAGPVRTESCQES